MGVIRGRIKVERKPPRRPSERTDQVTSFSGACEWLLMQYQEIDRKFPIINGAVAQACSLGPRTKRAVETQPRPAKSTK